MTSEIKKRIAQMNSGIVPKGYKKTKVGIVPVEWEETMFSNLFLILKNNTFSRAELNDEKGECFNIHYGDILTKFNTILDCDKVSLPFINQGMVIKTDYLIDGDIIIADTAEDNTAGKLIEIRNIHEKRIVSGLHTIPCRPKKKIAPKWLGYYMDSFVFHNQLIPIITGIKVSSISKNEIQKTSLVLPTLPEQQKIAEILSTQDKLIELKQKLIDLKKQQKKWLMQELLTEKKRLKGFSGEWRKVRIGDYIIEYTEKSTINNQYPILTSSRRGLMYQTEYFKDRQITTDNNIGYNILPKGYMTFRSRTDDGNFVFNRNNIIDKGIISYFYPVFKFKDSMNITFMQELLNYTIYRKFMPYVEGTAQQVLSIKKLGKLQYTIPPLEEQTAIAEILTQQDKEIEFLEKELELQKQKKKALMQLLLTGRVRVNT